MGLVLAPIGLAPLHAVIAYSGFAIACGAVGAVRRVSWLAAFSVVETILAFAGHLYPLSTSTHIASLGIQSGMLAMVAVSSMVATAALVRTFEAEANLFGTTGAAISSLLWGYFLALTFQSAPTYMTQSIAWPVGMAISALLLSALAYHKSVRSYVHPGAAIPCLSVGMVSYLFALGYPSLKWEHDFTAVIGLTVAAIAWVTAYIRFVGRDQLPMVGFVGFAWVCGSRLVVLLLPFGGTNFALSLAWIVTAAILITAGFLAKVVEFRFGAFAILASTAAKILFVDLADVDASMKAFVLLVLGIVTLAGAYGYIRVRANGAKAVH